MPRQSANESSHPIRPVLKLAQCLISVSSSSHSPFEPFLSSLMVCHQNLFLHVIAFFNSSASAVTLPFVLVNTFRAELAYLSMTHTSKPAYTPLKAFYLTKGVSSLLYSHLLQVSPCLLRLHPPRSQHDSSPHPDSTPQYTLQVCVSFPPILVLHPFVLLLKRSNQMASSSISCLPRAMSLRAPQPLPQCLLSFRPATRIIRKHGAPSHILSRVHSCFCDPDSLPFFLTLSDHRPKDIFEGLVPKQLTFHSSLPYHPRQLSLVVNSHTFKKECEPQAPSAPSPPLSSEATVPL